MDPGRIFRLLAEHGVRSVLVGGLAAAAQGASRLTYDVDLCFEQSEENCRRLASALAELGARTFPPREPPIAITAALLASHRLVHLATPAGRLDLIAEIPGLGRYEELIEAADRIRLGEIEVRVLSVEQLIRAKQAMDTPKDRDHLDQLLALRRLRDEQR